MPTIDLKKYVEDQYQRNETIDPSKVIDFDGKLESAIDPSSFYYHLILTGLKVVAIIAVMAIIYGGILYLTSAGDQEKTEMGKKTIIGAVIGLIVIMLSFVFYNYIIDSISI